MNQGSNVSVPTEEELNYNENLYEKANVKHDEKEAQPITKGNVYYIKDTVSKSIIKALCRKIDQNGTCEMKAKNKITHYPVNNPDRPAWLVKNESETQFLNSINQGGKRKKKTQKRKRTRTQKRKRTKTQKRKRTQKRR